MTAASLMMESRYDDSLAVKVCSIIADQFGVSPDRLTEKTRLRDDLRADRLDRLELMIAIEDRVTGVRIDDKVVDQLETIGDLMRVIESTRNGGMQARGATGAPGAR
ncbi:MAG TPA: acyl carrier protein [Xanthobacteraceae bacterium]|nr:acyl carrier protein [Xanthobacteraceae bacterium]